MTGPVTCGSWPVLDDLGTMPGASPAPGILNVIGVTEPSWSPRAATYSCPCSDLDAVADDGLGRRQIRQTADHDAVLDPITDRQRIPGLMVLASTKATFRIDHTRRTSLRLFGLLRRDRRPADREMRADRTAPTATAYPRLRGARGGGHLRDDAVPTSPLVDPDHIVPNRLVLGAAAPIEATQPGCRMTSSSRDMRAR